MTHCDSKTWIIINFMSTEHQSYVDTRSTKGSEAEWNHHANSRQSCVTAPPPPAVPAAAEEPLQQDAARSGFRRPALREW
jgi:hypothetical protein